jgi:serine/threonine protein kinase
LSVCDNEVQVTRNYSGTVTHMPPELIEDGKVYPQGDVYAFGIMMWEVRREVGMHLNLSSLRIS